MDNNIKCYCHKCNRVILFRDLNDNEREEFFNNNYCFVCSDCINKEMLKDDV